MSDEANIDFKAMWRSDGEESNVEVKATGNLTWCRQQIQRLLEEGRKLPNGASATESEFPKRSYNRKSSNADGAAA
jgi:hypothetical protein